MFSATENQIHKNDADWDCRPIARKSGLLSRRLRAQQWADAKWNVAYGCADDPSRNEAAIAKPVLGAIKNPTGRAPETRYYRRLENRGKLLRGEGKETAPETRVKMINI